jgi:CubicO group peptidase (beta-lactamase class C family)
MQNSKVNPEEGKGIKPLPDAEPQEAGFSAERLARIRPRMQRYIDQGLVPNIVTLVARDGKIVYLGAQGYLDCESERPAKIDSIFRLYSNSKPVTGAAVMMLYEDGMLDLDDPVSKYIPAFKNPLVLSKSMQRRASSPSMLNLAPASREITIRDCLRNTTGLAAPMRAPYALVAQYRQQLSASGWDAMESVVKPPQKSYLDRVEAHARVPLTFEPGTEFEYHVGYPVVGAVIEKITGQTLEEFYQERILQPLKMKDTSFYLGEGKLARLTTCYEPVRNNENWRLAIQDLPETSEKVRGPRINFGAGGDMGGLLSTVGDYARFGQMLLNGGELDGARILGRKSVELMTASHTGNIVIPMMGPGFGFGMGVGVYLGGSPRLVMRSPGTFGWGGAAGTTFFADPKERLLAICFTQVMHAMMMPGNTYQEEFERLVYQALM